MLRRDPILLLVLATSLLAACQPPWTGSSCKASIDWVNFIQVGDAQYVAGPDGHPLSESELGPVHAHVRFKVSGNVCDANYHPKDGDAAFLAAGTPIYEVAGRATTEELAARLNGQIVVYRRSG